LGRTSPYYSGNFIKIGWQKFRIIMKRAHPVGVWSTKDFQHSQPLADKAAQGLGSQIGLTRSNRGWRGQDTARRVLIPAAGPASKGRRLSQDYVEARAQTATRYASPRLGLPNGSAGATEVGEGKTPPDPVRLRRHAGWRSRILTCMKYVYLMTVEYVSAHGHSLNQAQGGHGGDGGRPSIGDKGQGDANHREKP
jgi:hypothetical protein